MLQLFRNYLTIILLSFLLVCNPVGAQQDKLFETIAPQAAASTSEARHSYLIRYSSPKLLPKQMLSVSLPELGDLNVQIKSAKISPAGNLVYTGALFAQAGEVGDLTLNVAKSGAMLGNVNVLAPHYRAVIKGESLTILSDRLALGCGGRVTAKIKPNSLASLSAASFGDPQIKSESTIDVLGVYTPDALVTLRSYGRVVSYFENQIAVANEAHSNSGSGITLNLVGIVALPTKSTDVYETDLERLANKSDGIWDSIPRIRDWYGADIVSLAVGGTQKGQICGLAYTPTSESELLAMTDYMYSVISADTDSCQESLLAHESGHNFGANHNSENASGGVIYPYAYGYRFDFTYQTETVKALTVMSYAPSSGYFSWIRYFSNPEGSYASNTTGVADAADNARVFRSTGPVAAAFKDLRSTLPSNANSITLKISKSGRTSIFSGLLKRSTHVVSGAEGALYWSSLASGSYKSLVTLATSGSTGRWRYTRTGAKRGYYKLCQAVCSSAVRLS